MKTESLLKRNNMKNPSLLAIRFGVAAFAIFLTSCQFQGIKGSGNVVTENRPVTEGFNAVKAGNGLEVVLEQADKAAIIVEADDNLQKHISTRIENGVLVISSDCNSFMNATKKITVQMPVITSVEVGSGANLNSKNTLKSGTISVKSSSGADIKIAIEAEKAICESSSGSSIDIMGKAIELETASSAGSSIDAEKLLSNTVTASASSGSTTDVYPLMSLKANATSGGNINYHKIPKNLNKSAGSGGSINKQ
jgi:hypothetical protein